MSSRTKKFLLLAVLVALPLVAWAARPDAPCCDPDAPCCPATSCPDPACCVR